MTFWFAQVFLGAVWTFLFGKTLFTSIRTPKLVAQPTPITAAMVDVLVPVRNEANRQLAEFLADLKAQNHAHLNIVIVDDRSTDGSGEIIDRVSKSPGREIRALTGAEPPHGWMGKTYALQQAKSEACGKWMALIDADVRLEPNAIALALNTALRSNAQAVCLLPKFVYRSFWVGAVLPVMIWLSIMRVSPTESNSSQTSAVFGFGNFILVNRESHDRIGGFERYRDHVLDDCELFRLIKQHGETTVVVDGALSVESEMYSDLRELVQGFTKNSFAAIGYNWSLAIATILFLTMSVLFMFGSSMSSFASFFYVVPLLLTSLIMTWRLRAPKHAFLLFPMSLLICGWIIARSAVRTGLSDGAEWKGRLVK